MVFNTIWTTFLATLIAVPISVLTALFITRIAPSSFKTFFFVSLSILASIPSVIYGAFGSRVIDWIIMGIFGTSSGALLTIVITLAFMIMPTITLITTASINAVDKKMETSSLALGATKNQTSFYITLRAAATGILVATILGVGRALGEATAVSMISVDPYTGPTLGLFNQIRLLTSTMFKGYNELEPDSIQEASMFAMALLLMITILFVFLTMRFVQKQQNPKHQSLKATKKIEEVQNLELIVEKSGLKNLSISKQKKYHKLQKKQKFNDEVHEYYSNKYNNEVLINKTTIKSTYEKEKARKSKLLGGLTWVVSSIGVLFLASIILFLVIAGYSGLSWEYISSTGDEGLQSAIFGTVLLIILSMALIIPLGIGTGIYFSVFAKDNKVNRILLTGIDILTGIPSLIFGIVGSVLFLSFANAIGFAPLAGAIILTLIVVPTVVQTTQEAIKSVPKESITGSLALGSTKTTSSLKIAIPQSIPQITSGIILAIGRIIGESAALVMIFGTVSRDSAADWMQLGGTTLATEMYSLTLLEEIPWHEIAAIGLVILSLILLLSLLSNYISKKDLIGSLGLLLSLLLILVGIFVAETIGFIIFILGILILIMTIFMSILNKRKR
ncbi:MAG: hypothetical protein TYPL_3070 [Candidatus Tyloplasma litorale]|nr:MAG: hypothetical protein TYPL_3070 [Mycoplasmatales bacterium]